MKLNKGAPHRKSKAEQASRRVAFALFSFCIILISGGSDSKNNVSGNSYPYVFSKTQTLNKFNKVLLEKFPLMYRVELDSNQHAGVANFIAPKKFKNQNSYFFKNSCWAYSLTPDPKNLRAQSWRTLDLTKVQFDKFIASKFGKNNFEKAYKTLRLAYPYAEQYCVDPLWITSLIFVESRFINNQKSSMKAYGPMQLIPGTGRLLSKKLVQVEDPGLAALLVKTPETNIKMGIFYFHHLLSIFHFNYEQATVAYNMGPMWVKGKIMNGVVQYRGHQYLEKIRAQYHNLVIEYLAWAKKNPPAYKNTLVAFNELSSVQKIRMVEFNLKEAGQNSQKLEKFFAYLDRLSGQNSNYLRLAHHEPSFLNAPLGLD